MIMHVHEYFADKADLYAQARPRYPQALYAWLAQQVPGRQRVWDAACGNGQAAVDLQEWFDEVQATDVSPQQIANASPHPRIHYSVQASEATDFADAGFDAVCVAQALHWFDYARFWPEVQRVLKPGGVFAAWGYAFQFVTPEIDAVVQRECLDLLEPYWAEQNKLLWDGYRAIEIPLAALPVPELEMAMEWNCEQFLAYIHTWSATRRCMEQQGEEFFLRLMEQVRALWGSEVRKVRMEFYLVAGRKAA